MHCRKASIFCNLSLLLQQFKRTPISLQSARNAAPTTMVKKVVVALVGLGMGTVEITRSTNGSRALTLARVRLQLYNQNDSAIYAVPCFLRQSATTRVTRSGNHCYQTNPGQNQKQNQNQNKDKNKGKGNLSAVFVLKFKSTNQNFLRLQVRQISKRATQLLRSRWRLERKVWSSGQESLHVATGRERMRQ